MRFAFVSTMRGWPWGGSEELWSQSASRLLAAGHDVFASLFEWAENRSRVQAFRQKGIVIETRPGDHASPAQRVLRKLSGDLPGFSRLRSFAPDLVLISQGHNGGGLDWARACCEAGIPFAIVVHCNSELWWFEDRELDDAVSAYRNARKVFCVSRGNLELLRFQLGEALPNASVVWNPYNVPPDSAPTWLESEEWRLASVARLDPAAKGQDILLKVLAQPKWRERPLHLSFYGRGTYEQELRKMARSLGVERISFCGHVFDIPSVWQQNHMLALPSRYEGLPLALVEAMWCGRPAVVTHVGGNAELCLDGQTGFVAEAATAGSFDAALERAWEQREAWCQLGRNARLRAEQLIPRDPISLFCEELISCIPGSLHAIATEKVTS